MEESTVLVLLAAYNGQAFIRQMVDSVLSQDYSNIKIILSDDSSSDDTASILAEYARAYPDRITHHKSGKRFGCAQNHFMYLLNQFHDAPYIMFCDQDDVWHKDKVRKTLCKMQQIESNTELPAMVHTDLRVVDGQLNEISPSFCKHSNLEGSRMALNQLLVQNVVTGCTMMINRPLAELACREIPSGAMLMHDWWLALLAAACGKTGYLDEATIDYRQHGNNSVGAKNIRSPEYLLKRLGSQKMRKSLENAAQQARVFLECYADVLSEQDKEILRDFAGTKEKGVIGRDLVYLRHRLYKYGSVRVIAQFLGL